MQKLAMVCALMFSISGIRRFSHRCPGFYFGVYEVFFRATIRYLGLATF